MKYIKKGKRTMRSDDGYVRVLASRSAKEFSNYKGGKYSELYGEENKEKK